MVTIGVLVAGLSFVVSALWLGFVGVFLLGVGVSWLLGIRRREPSEREDRQAIRTLWKLTRRIPTGRILVDPITGRQFGIHRRAGAVNLIVPRYLHDDARSDDDVLVTHYLVGSFGLPHPPPLLRHEELIRAQQEGPVPDMTRRTRAKFSPSTTRPEHSTSTARRSPPWLSNKNEPYATANQLTTRRGAWR